MNGFCVSMDLEDYSLPSWSDQPAGVLACLQWIFSSKLLNPKDDGSFILASLTNKSHQIYSRILLGPCFAVVVYVEAWWAILNVQLSYKPPSSCRVWPRQFILLKKFMALVVPGRGFRKGVILRGRQLNCRFSCGSPVMPEKKRGCNGRFCPWNQTEE